MSGISNGDLFALPLLAERDAPEVLADGSLLVPMDVLIGSGQR